MKNKRVGTAACPCPCEPMDTVCAGDDGLLLAAVPTRLFFIPIPLRLSGGQTMDSHLREFLCHLHEEGRSNDEREPDRSKKMLNLEPDTAQLIGMLTQT